MAKVYRLDSVLVVEDEFLIAHDIEQRLTDLGFEQIYLALNLQAAKEILKTKRVGLALLDVNLGRELVFPLATELSERKIPFIFCTALGPGQLPWEWAEHPAIPKPFDEGRFMRIIERMGH